MARKAKEQIKQITFILAFQFNMSTRTVAKDDLGNLTTILTKFQLLVNVNVLSLFSSLGKLGNISVGNISSNES